MQQLETEVEHRFGVVPNFFRLAPESPEITANLWGFARFAYLDNPLPSLFKERLFVYLSRFCDVRYCIARHVGFLVGLGRPSGDGQCPVQTVEQVMRLIRRPFPRAEHLEPYVTQCAACDPPLAELPDPDSALEEAIFACATHAFLQTPDAPRCLEALKRVLGESRFQHLMVFLAFVRTAHYWTKVHTELVIEEDLKQLLATHEILAECLFSDPEAGTCEISQKLMDELTSLRESKERHDEVLQAHQALRDSERRFREMIDALPAAIYTTDAEGRLTHFNPAAVEFSGRVPELGTDYWCVSWKLYHPDGTPMPHDKCPMAIALKEGRAVRGAEAIAERPDGKRIWFMPYPTPLRDSEGRVAGGINMLLDITERKQAEGALRQSATFLRLQKQSLEMLVKGSPLREVLATLARAMQNQSKQKMLAAIHLLDEGGTRFQNAIAPSLPQSYCRATEGMEVHSKVGPCCWAVLSGETVLVSDITADSQWNAFAEFAQPLGIRSAWSAPIFSTDGKMLGTFANYYPEPGTLSAQDLQVVEVLTRTVALAIERKRAEETLRFRTAQFETLLNQAPLGVYLVDADLRIREVNPVALPVFGDIPGGVIGRDFDEIIHILWEKQYADEIVRLFRHTLATGEPYITPERAEFRLDRGLIEYYEWRLDRITLPDGRYGLVCYFRDISAQVFARQIIAASEERYRSLTGILTSVVWTTDAQGAFIAPQPEWEAFTGQAWEEYQGWGWVGALHPEDREPVQALWRQALETRSMYESQGRLWHAPSGGYHYYVARAVPLLNGDGSVREWIGNVLDVQEQKEAEVEREKLLAAERMAREAASAASRAKDEFLATVSHELRTPLNAMLGWARLLSGGTLDDETAKRGLKAIEQNAKSQAQLIEDLLDVSRIISGKFRLNNEPVQMVRVIEAAVDSVRPAAEAKGVRLQVTLDPGAGPVLGDAGRLQQVVWNLLSNAVKFTPRDGRVQVGLIRVNSHVEIVVSDTGQGMAPEFLPYVFDRFRQADGSLTRTHGGLGLGLAIVRHIAELHGGSVAADSPGKGKGATFTVRLPLMVMHTKPGGEERAHPRVDGEVALHFKPSVSLEGVRVLVVDDDPETLLLLSTFLTQCGAYVKTAASAEEGFREVKSWRPDVVVSDIGMPGEDGYAFMKRVRTWAREVRAWIPAIALTAYARAEDRMKALASGYQMHVPKPVEPAELITVIASLIERPATLWNADP